MKQGGKRVIMLKIAAELPPRVAKAKSRYHRGRRGAAGSDDHHLGSRVTSQSEVAGEIRQSAQMIFLIPLNLPLDPLIFSAFAKPLDGDSGGRNLATRWVWVVIGGDEGSFCCSLFLF